MLAEHFRETFSRELERPVRCFSPGAQERLCAHSWPGNVRELKNTVERAVLMCDRGTIRVSDLSLSEAASWDSGASAGELGSELPIGGLALADVERRAVELALARTGYVQKDAAELLGVTRRKLNYVIRRLGLTHPSWRRNRPRSDEVSDGG